MWHVDAEIIALLFMTVIIIDVIATSMSRTLKDQMFRMLSFVTYLAIAIDIYSSAAMMEIDRFSWWAIEGSLLLYFIFTPMLSVLWHLYAISVVNKASKKLYRIFFASAIPFLLYLPLVASNPVTGLIFGLSPAKVYVRGPLFNLLFVLFYGYGLATLLYALMKFKTIERTTAVILTIFPLIAGAGVLLQQLWPGYLVTGSAFTLVLLITYLFLQNRKRTRDSLTGLYNRLAFSDAVDRLSKREERGFVMAVALDDFKLFNQTFGQGTGDELLKEIGESLVSLSPVKTCYRYGGDIFTLILRKRTAQEVNALAADILRQLKQFSTAANVGCTVSACLGIVEYPCVSDNKSHSIVSALDFAIYQAKKRGKGQIAFYDEELIGQLQRKRDLAEALERAIAEKSFEVYLQPIYHMKRRAFTYGEALLRLRDPVLGPISPAEFIPIAEETGKIVEITYLVLETVCAFLNDHRDTLRDEIAVSVNFSMVQFMQRDMTQRVLEILDRYKVSPSLIKIEVTESIIATSLGEIKSAMATLTEFGIRFALDDYGQGYSNIAYLINLPFDFVKLDKSILDGVVENDRFLKALVPMFKSLDKIVIAEGVETEAQAALVAQTACDGIQGFHFARPMPMEQALSFFRRDQ